MKAFGIAWRCCLPLPKGLLPKLHVWLHQAGLLRLFLMMTRKVAETTIGPVFPVFEGAILLGAVPWLVNLISRA